MRPALLILFALALSTASARAQGFDFIGPSNVHTNEHAPFLSQAEPGGSGWVSVTAQPWTPSADSVTREFWAVMHPGDFDLSLALVDSWSVEIWSGADAFLADPTAGDVLSHAASAPDLGSSTLYYGGWAGGEHFRFGFSIPPVVLPADVEHYLAVVAHVTFAGAFWVGIAESDLGTQSALQVNITPPNPASAMLVADSLLSSHQGVSAYRLVADVTASELWSDVGNALAGSAGEPTLLGVGTLAPSSPLSLELSDAQPLAAAALVIGLGPLLAPFKGGVMVPTVDLLLAGVSTDAGGGLILPTAWPSGVPSGVSVWFQIWVADATGPVGYAASNGLTATAP